MKRQLLLLLPLLLASWSMPLSAQEDAPQAPPPPDAELPGKVDELKDIVNDKKFTRDAEGLGVITTLVQKWQQGLNDKDKAVVVKALDGVLQKGKLRPADMGQLYVAAATALGQLGKDGSKPLKSAFDGSRFPNKPDWVPLREAILKAMGKTKDESQIKFLVEVARQHPEAQLEAAAGEALGNFEDSKLETRKDIVRNLLIRYGEIDSRARQIDPADIEAQNMQKRLNVISGKWNSTLGRLSGQSFNDFPGWNEWFNKSKNRDKDWK